MRHGSQTLPERPPPTAASVPVVLVAGPAGSGKTTLGTALARRLGAVPLDLDSLTNPLLDALDGVLPGPHWLRGPHAGQVRSGRYAVLRAAARDALAVGRPVVLIAPFTAELQGGPEWAELREALAPHPVRVVHLDGPPELLADRRAARGEVRDQHRDDRPAQPPRVAHTAIHVLLSPQQQEFRAAQALGVLPPIDTGAALFDRTFDAVLCDLDGTLADSTASVLRCWAQLAGEFGFPADAVQHNHGRPAETLLSEYLPAEQVPEAVARVEELEVGDVQGVSPLPGAVELLADLPRRRVAVVTSATRPVAVARMAAAGVRDLGALVTREDVVSPKPAPEPFLRAAQALGVDPRRCLVLEDAPAGVRSARAAGCAVLAVLGTVEPVELADADLVVHSLAQVRARHLETGVRLFPA